MKRHGRSHVGEREPAAEGHIIRARLMRGDGRTRADRGLDNRHETRRTTLPVLLTVDEAADLLRTSRRAIYAMIERRQLPGVIRVRRRVLLRADDLLDWLDQKRAPSPEE
jgi:excisionase family DNA binding protein